MKPNFENLRAAIDDMSLRERAMIFVAAAFLVLALMDVALLEPLLVKQKSLSAQVVQQQEKMKELQAQLQNLLQAKRDEEHSPLRERVAELNQQLKDQESYLQSRRDRLVAPDKMADLLRQVLDKNGSLRLVELKTLPASLLIENTKSADVKSPDGNAQPDAQRQIYKHGVRITVRGGYLDLLRYVTALEKMPTQMFWGEAGLAVEKYPDAVFTLTLYTLSLDKIWLAV